jgi:hypothetical protein
MVDYGRARGNAYLLAVNEYSSTAFDDLVEVLDHEEQQELDDVAIDIVFEVNDLIDELPLEDVGTCRRSAINDVCDAGVL